MRFTRLASRNLSGLVVIGACLAWISPAAWSAPEIDITRDIEGILGFPKPIPVSISGYSREVESVLKQDLMFMGFSFTGPNEAQFLITPADNDSSRVSGRVVDRISKAQRFAKAYTGVSVRAQTHALADDIAVTLTQKPGIAQTKIAFKVETGGGRGEIYISDYDGFNARAVTQDRVLIAAPCWADRSTLLYASYKYGPVYIYSHQLSSGTRKAVASYPGMNSSPAVSPDGRRVAMILSKNGNPELYVGDIGGGNVTRLTKTQEAESSPCWSPDGKQICFVSRARGPASLYTIAASGGQMRQLKAVGESSPTEPDWSPDGKWIAFTSITRRSFQICIVPSQGGAAQPLVEGEDPSWAANSRALIFSKGPDHAKKLYVLDVPTRQMKDIARILESNSQPSWAKFK